MWLDHCSVHGKVTDSIPGVGKYGRQPADVSASLPSSLSKINTHICKTINIKRNPMKWIFIFLDDLLVFLGSFQKCFVSFKHFTKIYLSVGFSLSTVSPFNLRSSIFNSYFVKCFIPSVFSHVFGIPLCGCKYLYLLQMNFSFLLMFSIFLSSGAFQNFLTWS